MIHSTSDSKNGEEKLTENSNNPSPSPFVFVVFLDATWKYAKEMDRANQQYNQYPIQTQRVQLDKSTFENSSNFIARRFEMFRTPISDYHLSTAECIARVLTSIESSISSSQQHGRTTYDNNNDSNSNELVETIFDQVMKPLDLMVQQSKSFLHGSEKKQRKSTQQQSKIR
jgi:DTW domain-containing protein YfiP